MRFLIFNLLFPLLLFGQDFALPAEWQVYKGNVGVIEEQNLIQSFMQKIKLSGHFTPSQLAYLESTLATTVEQQNMFRGAGSSGGGDLVSVNDQLYLLDLVEAKIEKNPSVTIKKIDDGYTPSSNRRNKIRRVERLDTPRPASYEFQSIVDERLFEKIQTLNPTIFGSKIENIDKVASYQFRKWLHEYNQLDLLDDILSHSAIAQELNGVPKEEIIKSDLSDEQRARKNILGTEIHSYWQQGDLYSHQSYITIGLINKINQIANRDFQVAKIIVDTLLKLKWVYMNAAVPSIDDEGLINVDFFEIFQGANRLDGVVRISPEGWDRHVIRDQKLFSPLNNKNKIALIMHEVIYQLTRKHGHQTSETARKINAQLFMNGQEEAAISELKRISASDK